MNSIIVAAVGLGAIFGVGAAPKINFGLLDLFDAFVVGVGLVRMGVDDVIAGFPVDRFLALLGSTLLFGFAQRR